MTALRQPKPRCEPSPAPAVVSDGLNALVWLLGTLILAVALFYWIPRGEWLAGGWDPGVYMNTGIHHVVRHHQPHDPPPVLQDLTELDFNPFVREIGGRQELFPGIPMDSKTRTLQHTFYPLTPAWISLLYRIGGIDLAFHAMSIIGLILLLVMPWSLTRCGLSRFHAQIATILTLASPLTLYHLRTPCSETLELLLVALIPLWLSLRKSSLILLVGAMLACAGTLNRPTFFIWCGLLLAALVVCRQFTWTRGVGLVTGTVAGACYYWTRNPAAWDRLGHVTPTILLGLTLLLGATIAFAIWYRLRSSRVPSRALLILLPLGIIVGLALLHPHGLQEAQVNIRRLALYLGWPYIALGLIGGTYWLRHAWRHPLRAVDAWILTCVCATLVPVIYKFVAELYPWATKRFLSSAPLIASVFSAFAIQSMAQWAPHRIPRGLAASSILIVLLAWQWPMMRDAGRNVEYEYLHETLAEIAQHIEPNDIIIADHFVWATPLHMAFGAPVLSGERLWADPSPRRIAAASTFLLTQHHRGRRILFLTSTENGPNVFPSELFARQDPTALPAVHAFAPYTYSVILHHQQGRGFPLTSRTAEFRLYQWTP